MKIKTRSEILGIRFTTEEKKEIEEIAKENNCKVSEVLYYVIKNYIKQYKEKGDIFDEFNNK